MSVAALARPPFSLPTWQSSTELRQLIPTAFYSLSDPCLPDLFTTIYRPIPGVIMMIAMFCLFAIEIYINTKTGTGHHAHGSLTPTDAATDSGADPDSPDLDLIPPPTINQHTAEETNPVRRPARSYTQSSADTLVVNQTEDDVMKPAAEEMRRDDDAIINAQHSPIKVPPKATDGDMPPWFALFYKKYAHQRRKLRPVQQASPHVHVPSRNARRTNLTITTITTFPTLSLQDVHRHH